MPKVSGFDSLSIQDFFVMRIVSTSLDIEYHLSATRYPVRSSIPAKISERIVDIIHRSIPGETSREIHAVFIKMA